MEIFTWKWINFSPFIIEKDTTVIDKTNTVADKNAERLKKEADRLQEHTKSSCRCWIWLLCVIVMVTFICEYFFCYFSKTYFFFQKTIAQKVINLFFSFAAMVWVMKFFRKRSDYWDLKYYCILEDIYGLLTFTYNWHLYLSD